MKFWRRISYFRNIEQTLNFLFSQNWIFFIKLIWIKLLKKVLSLQLKFSKNKKLIESFFESLQHLKDSQMFDFIETIIKKSPILIEYFSKSTYIYCSSQILIPLVLHIQNFLILFINFYWINQSFVDRSQPDEINKSTVSYD